MWFYKILKIQPKFAKYLEACYRIKLQYLQGTMSYKGTTKLGGKGMGGGGDNKLEGGLIDYFILANWGDVNKLKYLEKKV